MNKSAAHTSDQRSDAYGVSPVALSRAELSAAVEVAEAMLVDLLCYGRAGVLILPAASVDVFPAAAESAGPPLRACTFGGYGSEKNPKNRACAPHLVGEVKAASGDMGRENLGTGLGCGGQAEKVCARAWGAGEDPA